MERLSIVSLLLFSVFAIAKSSYRPPLVVENVVSEDVRMFLEKSKKNEKVIKKSNYDLLGRKKQEMIPLRLLILQQPLMLI